MTGFLFCLIQTTEIIAELEGRSVNENNIERKEFKLEFILDEHNMHKGYNLNIFVNNVYMYVDTVYMLLSGSDINEQISQDQNKFEVS